MVSSNPIGTSLWNISLSPPWPATPYIVSLCSIPIEALGKLLPSHSLTCIKIFFYMDDVATPDLLAFSFWQATDLKYFQSPLQPSQTRYMVVEEPPWSTCQGVYIIYIH